MGRSDRHAAEPDSPRPWLRGGGKYEMAARREADLVANENRGWPPPKRPWLLFMQWLDLTFLHWPVDPDPLRERLPAGLTLDTYDGQAWIGVTPFCMSGVRPRYGPSLPWLSRFPELNVRTYVSVGGKPGIWFFGLEASNPVAVLAARWAFRLPYYRARMAVEQRDGWIHYRSERRARGAPSATFIARCQPTGDVYQARPGNLDHWLSERYCLYTVDRQQRLYRGEIDHAPWPLQPAVAEIEINTMGTAHNLLLPEESPLVHFSRRQDVVAWYLQRVGAG
jgi:uncharacterized protein